jgi:SDR family mycofactocin-dependent oxidoreductase
MKRDPMGKLDGKVVFITGAARGQGRSHALRLAEEGAKIIATDICQQIESVPYGLGTSDDLIETARLVESVGSEASTAVADVRDPEGLRDAFEKGRAEFGGVDIVLANAGIFPISKDPAPSVWNDVLDVNLTGVYNTLTVVAPTLVEQGRGGSIVITSSTAALRGTGTDSPGLLGYITSKMGVIGLMRSYANLLGPHGVRVNTVHPTGVRTAMVTNPAAQEFLSGMATFVNHQNVLPVDMLEPLDVSNAIAWLVSDEARYVTGTELVVDAGFINN